MVSYTYIKLECSVGIISRPELYFSTTVSSVPKYSVLTYGKASITAYNQADLYRSVCQYLEISMLTISFSSTDTNEKSPISCLRSHQPQPRVAGQLVEHRHRPRCTKTCKTCPEDRHYRTGRNWNHNWRYVFLG